MLASWGVLLAAVLINAAVIGSEAVTPIQKVLEMMKHMKTTAIADQKDEQVKFSTFSQWCTDTSAEKKKLIEAATSKLEELDAEISQAASDIQEANADLSQLEADMAGYATDEKAATEIRIREKADFEAELASYVKVLEQLDRAIRMLKELPSNTPGAETSMLQRNLESLARAPQVPTHAQKAIGAFIQDMIGTGSAHEAPEAHAYSKQSDGVLGMMKELKTRFFAEKTNLEKDEMNTRHAYDMLKQKLTDQVEGAKRETAVKTQFRGKRAAAKSEAEGDLAETSTAKKEDESYLSDLTALCTTKTSDFQSRQKLRADEIEALGKAIDIISSNTVSEGPSSRGVFIQKASFAQLRSASVRSPALERVASLLREQATKLGSQELALAAQQATSDPFIKVKKMIKNLLMKLMEEASQEADHKAYCRAELGKNELTRKNKAEEVDELQAEVERLTATCVKLGQEIDDLNDDIVELDKQMVKATELRNDEKATNAKTVSEAKEGQEAVAQARAVLHDFYAKAATATALAQQPAVDAPETFDSSYKGLQDESTGVLGMLEVIQDDFVREQTSTEASEAEAQSAYEKLMAESEKTKVVKKTDMEHKKEKKTTAETMLTSTQDGLRKTQDELDAALNYYDKLKPTCVDTGYSYEERVSQRLEELESLKEAYKILSGEELPTLSAMKAEQIGAEIA